MPTAANFGCNADVASGANIYAGGHTQNQWLDLATFVLPPLATQIGQTDYSPLGGSPTQARGTHFNNIDFSIFKEISLEKYGRLEFRAEAFNLTNTPQFGQPGNLDFLSSPNFSQINSLRNNPRLWQFALKYYF